MAVASLLDDAKSRSIRVVCMTMHQQLQVTLVLFSQSYMCCTIPENPSPEWFISFRDYFLAGSRWGRAEFCLIPDSNDWLERHHVKGVVWCKFKCQLGKWVEWSGGLHHPIQVWGHNKIWDCCCGRPGQWKSLMQEQWSAQRKFSLKA